MSKYVNDVADKHLVDVEWCEELESPCVDVMGLSSVHKESLGVCLCCPIRDGEFCYLVPLHVGFHRIFEIVLGSQWHEGIG